MYTLNVIPPTCNIMFKYYLLTVHCAALIILSPDKQIMIQLLWCDLLSLLLCIDTKTSDILHWHFSAFISLIYHNVV